MRKILIACLSLLIICAAIQAHALSAAVQAAVSVNTAAAKSCATDSTLLLTVDSTDSFYNMGWASTKIYTGQAAFNPSDLGGNATVCKVEFNIRQIAGTGSDISAKARIFNMSSTSLGTDPSGTCTSNTKTVTGSYPIGYTPAFDGLACDVDSGSTYGITLARADGSYDEANYIQIFVKQTSAITGYTAEWASDKSRTNDDSTFDISMKIYGFLR